MRLHKIQIFFLFYDFSYKDSVTSQNYIVARDIFPSPIKLPNTTFYILLSLIFGAFSFYIIYLTNMPGCNCQLQIVICLFLTWNYLHSVYLAILKVSVHMNFNRHIRIYCQKYYVVDGHFKLKSLTKSKGWKKTNLSITK
jgi:hypothetical protein